MARKQEQEPAREEVTEVAPNVLRFELPIRMPGLGHVNCYALVDGDGVALVDPGLPGPATWRALVDRLRKADLEVRHVHSVLVTHSHPDHFGGASRFAREAGAKVIAHRAFRFGLAAEDHPEASVEDLAAHSEHEGEGPVAGHDPDGTTRAPAEPEPAAIPRSPMSHRGRTPWGGEPPRPSFRMRMRWRLMRLLRQAPFVPDVTHAVRHGDTLQLAKREWRVVHTPGHTEDHFCLHDPETGLFLAGDHVLPTITPHISGLSTYHDPLAAFFESLERVAEIEPITQVLPAHGHPFDDLADRCRAIHQHHVERLDKVKSIGRDIGMGTVEAYMQQLFRERSWGSMAESETYAHLEHLRLLGEAERADDERGHYLYGTG